jgi:alkanesulfonate monooxygenase SsuD/methylene tetrahydromethanopterin reductase-like flavin-dependent oxidoreductase (luciferase family)
MLHDWQRVWGGESFGFAGAIGPRPPRGRPTLMIGGQADAAFRRAATFGDGWIMGGGAPDQFGSAVAKLEAAWAEAGREDRPRKMALAYYALGDRAREAADGYLTDYYGFLGDYAGMIASSAAVDEAGVNSRIGAFAAAGCDELILFPCDPDPGQVDLLADAIR